MNRRIIAALLLALLPVTGCVDDPTPAVLDPAAEDEAIAEDAEALLRKRNEIEAEEAAEEAERAQRTVDIRLRCTNNGGVYIDNTFQFPDATDKDMCIWPPTPTVKAPS